MDATLHCLSFDDLSETPGAGAEVLAAFDYQISTWTDAETKAVKHTLYFPSSGEADEAAAILAGQTPQWEAFGVVLANPLRSSLKKEDWAESWKIHFKLMEVSERLAIKPSWVEFQPKPGQKVVVLDPGMSFGTGQHATTKSCLKAIDLFAAEAKAPLSMLDAGCGSGILAIAARKLGCEPVEAFDIDPDAVKIARENCRINGIADAELPMATASLEAFDAKGRRFDIVAANILSSALLAGKETLLSFCVPDGKLILAGILEKEYPAVKEAFEKLGCVELFAETGREWRGGAFRVPKK